MAKIEAVGERCRAPAQGAPMTIALARGRSIFTESNSAFHIARTVEKRSAG
jgi:hypothetical protein